MQSVCYSRTWEFFVTPPKGASFSAGLQENKIEITVKLSAAADDFAWPLIHLPR